MENLAGVWAAALTPLDEALDPDPRRGADHAARLLAAGCHGIVVFGTTGEAPSFTVTERMAYLEALLAEGLPPDRVIVGTGGPSLGDAVTLSRHAVEAGCAGVLVVPPYYFKDPSVAGLLRFYDGLIRGVGAGELRLLLYHFPQMAGVGVTSDLIASLIQRHGPTIAGLKDSSGDAAGTAEFVEQHPGLAVFPGSERFMLPMLRRGAVGCISASANLNPHGIRAVYDAWQIRDTSADLLHAEAVEVRRILGFGRPVATLKAVLAEYLADPAWRRVRPPFADSDLPDSARLVGRLEALGFAPRL